MKPRPQTLALAVVLGVMAFIGTPRSSAETSDSEQITQLLADAKSHALQLEDDAATLESYVRSRAHWRSHAIKLEAMKKHVNEMGGIASQMKELEPQGSPWQQQAIAQVTPLLREMAGSLSNTIELLNENQSHIHMQAYRDYSRTNYTLARKTASLIGDFVDYDRARSAAESLEHKLVVTEK
jgi:hypothetical protein